MRITDTFWILLKFQIKYKLGFRRLLDAVRGTKYGKIAAGGAVFLVLLLAGCILGPYIFLMYVLYGSCAAAGNIEGYFNTAFLLCNFVTFFIALLSSHGILFAGKDREILTPLPIRKHFIFLTAYFTLYLGALCSSLLFLLPAVLIYEFYAGFSAVFLLKAFLAALTFPLLPLTIAFVFMSLFLAVASGFRHKELLGTIFGALLVLGCFFLNGNQSRLIQFAESGSKFTDTAGVVLFNGFFMREALLKEGAVSWLYLLFSVLTAVFLVCLASLYGGAVYDKILQRMNFAAAVRGGKKADGKKHGAAYAFFRKEMITVLRSPVYALNCLIPVLLALPAAFLLARDNSVTEALHVLLPAAGNEEFVLLMLGVFAASVFMALNLMPSTSFSREGRSFWITKMIPAALQTQVKGRAAAAILFDLLCSVLFLIPFGILLKINFLYIIYGLVILLASAVPFTCGSLAIDLSHPKLIWDREAEAVKQNFNGMLGMLLSVLLAVIHLSPFFLYLTGSFPHAAVITAVPVMILLTAALSIFVLNKKIKALEG